MELAVRAFIITVFAAVVGILGFSMGTAAIATQHLAHPVTQAVSQPHLRVIEVAGH